MSAAGTFKTSALQIMRHTGVFWACQRLTERGLPILCYHGISRDDEHQFRKKLFMSPALFAQRMHWLKSRRYKVLTLDEAVDSLENGRLPSKCVVITFDDGWYGCLEGAFDLLDSLNFPSTLYVTTYYSQQETPVFNLAVNYLLWKTPQAALALADLGHGLTGRVQVANPQERSAAATQIVQVGEQLDSSQRNALLYRLAECVGLNPADLFENKKVCVLLNTQELQQAATLGVDLQLHTHRHRLPLNDDAAVAQEIHDNRQVLRAITQRELKHLCYPSGVFSPAVFAALRKNGVTTATTTNPGLNYAGVELLELNRFLDGEDVAHIELHAELAGVGQMLRRLRS